MEKTDPFNPQGRKLKAIPQNDDSRATASLSRRDSDAANELIESQASLDKVWIFHSHDGAVDHARRIGEVLGETPDVVKLD